MSMRRHPRLAVMASLFAPSAPAAHLPADAARLAGPLALRDGATIHVRAIRPDDAERLRAFHASLSPDTILFRFFRLLPELSPEEAARFTQLDYENRMALVATAGPEPDAPILGVARYDRAGPEEAEVAFVVRDRWQGRGVAPALLHRLAPYARARGITTLVALTMASNGRMLAMLRGSGFPCAMRFAAGEVEARLDIAGGPRVP